MSVESFRSPISPIKASFNRLLRPRFSKTCLGVVTVDSNSFSEKHLQERRIPGAWREPFFALLLLMFSPFWLFAKTGKGAFSAFVRLCSRLMLMTRDEHHRTGNDVDGLYAGGSVSMAGMETLRAGCLPETDRGITVGRGFLCYGTGLLCGWDVPRIYINSKRQYS